MSTKKIGVMIHTWEPHDDNEFDIEVHDWDEENNCFGERIDEELSIGFKSLQDAHDYIDSEIKPKYEVVMIHENIEI